LGIEHYLILDPRDGTWQLDTSGLPLYSRKDLMLSPDE